MKKTLKEAFKDVKIPESLESTEIKSLTVDTEKRGVMLLIKPDSLPSYEEIEKLKKVLIKSFVLNEICVKTVCDKEEALKDINLFKEFVIGEISDECPICKYIFEGSEWLLEGENLKITIKHGCMPIIKDEKMVQKIKNIFKRCEIPVEIVIDEQFEEFEAEIPAPA